MIDDLIFWVVDGLFDFFSRKHYSGQWHFSHLLPLIIVLFGGIWWLGSRLESVPLLVLGVSGAIISFTVELFIFIPREIADWRDFKAYCNRSKKEAESKCADSKEKE